jgi:mannitol-1-phosphate 5-dehydrogenase
MNITVVGAGKTGRGFIGRLLHESGQAVRFIDSNHDLIEALRASKRVGIRYFGNVRHPSEIVVDTAYHTSEPAGVRMVAASDLVFVSVGANNLTHVARYLATALDQRDGAMEHPLVIITAENAINPAMKLQTEIEEFLTTRAPFSVTESAIFCSTIEADDTVLDIQSEDFNSLPFDSSRIPLQFPMLEFLKPEENFPLLLIRKIYTYNCASAAIAYLGSLKGYHLYGDAANDPEIETLLTGIYSDVNTVLCREYAIDPSDQTEFALRSKRKFQNRDILDSVERNARDASRKLAADERLIGPLLLTVTQGLLSHSLCLVIAAAIHYAYVHHENPLQGILEKEGVAGVLSEISGITDQPAVVAQVESYYMDITAHIPLKQIMSRVTKQDGGGE